MVTDQATYTRWWRQNGHEAVADYTAGITSFVVGLSPEQSLAYSGVQLARILHDRLGAEDFRQAIDPSNTVASHLTDREDGEWLTSCHTVGVNVRTIGSYWNLLKYALTLPDHIRGIHLLPIWEPGVVGSLYGMASWQLNTEFFDLEAVRMFPQLATTEDQLRVVINLLHAMGKVVGMDVIPHTDRYSEMVLANPAYFEWLRREDLRILDHRANLHEEAEMAILAWLKEMGGGTDLHPDAFFRELPEEDRLLHLFGKPEDRDGRRDRRVSLVDYLYHRGLEPVPATMAPPYRGLEVDPDPAALTIDEAGRRWRDYRITQPTGMSRVFGPLTRYKFYDRKNDNRDWAIDFDRPRPEVWDYFTRQYAGQQSRYNFDFMRGDMSHVQMRPGGQPETIDAYYDPLLAVKRRIASTTPHFAYFAESFLAPPDHMAYGDEVQHLMASEAEVTLGNLQSLVPGSDEFLEEFESYLEIAEVTPVTPAFTVITGDKDDPRFDHFHHHGEIARFFTGLFLGRLPLYYSLGFEQRDRHFSPAPNERYTKLYVFQERNGPKSVAGPWQWGQNFELFWELQKLHRFAPDVLRDLLAATDRVIIEDTGLCYWWRSSQINGAEYLFLANFSERSVAIDIPLPDYYLNPTDLFACPSNYSDEASLAITDRISGTLPGGSVRCFRFTTKAK
ncbi:MAG: hypothetical protein WA952_13265 [Lewinella sp.]